jgi:hypothetical protein
VLAPNARLRALVVPQEPEVPGQEAKTAECEANCAHHRPARLSWAKLLKRLFEIDMEHCPNCGGELKIIAAILEQPVIEKILTQWGLQARASPRAPARGQRAAHPPGRGHLRQPGSLDRRRHGPWGGPTAVADAGLDVRLVSCGAAHAGHLRVEAAWRP